MSGVADGITARLLKEGTSEDPSVVMELTFAPGAAFGEDAHSLPEVLVVTDGVFGDGEREYGKGSIIVGAPGSVHFPQSKDGCTVLAFHPAGR
ncbi:cupin domain-containing protein [Yinghuangia sp. ASG 101]|nr:cupin domain-containing protein [Yinghuangia sp. ASG 101]UGQ11510.1 cupin domain-containing protein [Yinghuangia sp. ASG 101]